jgi:hypothetical protein
VCDEHGIGGGSEYCGCNDAQLGRISVLYHEALDGKYVPRAFFLPQARRDWRYARVAVRRALPPW